MASVIETAAKTTVEGIVPRYYLTVYTTINKRYIAIVLIKAKKRIPSNQ